VKNFADIAFIAYKRPEPAARALDSLAADPEAPQSRLVAWADYPADAAAEPGALAVRELLAAEAGRGRFAAVELRFAAAHLGLAASVTGAVAAVLENSERVIVVEDDLELAPGFLRFMNAALDKYADNKEVVSIHGFTPFEHPGCYFLRGADCWGWATWRDRWMAVFEPDARKLLARFSPAEAKKFDLDGAYPFTKMLRNQAAGRLDSWAIRFHAAAFLAGGYTLYPPASLVRNTGLDGSGTHCGKSDAASPPWNNADFLPLPDLVAEDADARRKMAAYYRSTVPSPRRRALAKLRKIFS